MGPRPMQLRLAMVFQRSPAQQLNDETLSSKVKIQAYIESYDRVPMLYIYRERAGILELMRDKHLVITNAELV